MEIGNIIYLHIFNIEPILLVTQELREERFCKVIDAKPVKGGKKGEQYMKYSVQSLLTNKVFEVNNYIGPYSCTSIEDIKEIIKEYENDLNPTRLENMKAVLDNIISIIE